MFEKSWDSSNYSYRLGSWNLSLSTSTGLIYLSQATTDCFWSESRLSRFSESTRTGWAPQLDLSWEQMSHMFKVIIDLLPVMIYALKVDPYH